MKIYVVVNDCDDTCIRGAYVDRDKALMVADYWGAEIEEYDSEEKLPDYPQGMDWFVVYVSEVGEVLNVDRQLKCEGNSESGDFCVIPYQGKGGAFHFCTWASDDGNAKECALATRRELIASGEWRKLWGDWYVKAAKRAADFRERYLNSPTTYQYGS